ncbi:hypothetical protein GDO81_006359 [Engystomops pustulosus]|uniref:Uncharacterized protein n=1 Tax=Engystomops pustulosus TaxID=76066 RepID=A0AAV7CXB3_ENGPU|nr:hypothetical protein GDO81_006359 [Engystomops pustulosus]
MLCIFFMKIYYSTLYTIYFVLDFVQPIYPEKFMEMTMLQRMCCTRLSLITNTLSKALLWAQPWLPISANFLAASLSMMRSPCYSCTNGHQNFVSFYSPDINCHLPLY